jgi:hypothetical protein
MNHDVDCGECHTINGNDLLGFDDDDHCQCRGWVNDPEEDIERRIVAMVEKQIGDILSDVFQQVMTASFSDVIQINDRDRDIASVHQDIE